ncbi:MAG: MiaB/RimO family radical SAM methylthiotransferase [Ignavibacteriales bacterium]|nr:MiaB/RimO family radical SAM methylthiotransferase [Ignavibacteriales bacterium]
MNKFYLKQFGCPSNRSDGNKIANFLISNDWKMSELAEADVIIIMSCGFATLHQNQTLNSLEEVHKLKKSGAKVWLGGCLPAISPLMINNSLVDRTFNPTSLKVVNELVNNQNDINQYYPFSTFQYITKLPENAYYLRISTGCTEKCSYCSIRKATGKLKSRKVRNIISEVEVLNKKSINSISLVGEDIGCYGLDINETIFNLILKLSDFYPNITFYLSSIHPKYFIKNFDTYVKIFSFPNIGRRLSIPIQSGSNKILKRMGRNYNIEEVKENLTQFHYILPEVELATDVMVGFPTETDDDFKKTRSLIYKFNFDYIDCFKYDDYAGISSYNFRRKISEDIKIKRLKIISFDVINLFFRKKNISTKKELIDFIYKSDEKIPLNTNFKF